MSSTKTTRKVRKVRAMVTDAKGRPYGIVGDAPHILQLPGGSLKSGESWRDALVREMGEEIGCEVKVTGKPVKITVHRNGVKEITRCYPVVITKKIGKPVLTGREAARGLRTKRYPSTRKLISALQSRVARYGRSAARRDLALAEAF
jgi:8-oxo-dGTP pyrophosphatase MutT (NUDIX family)